MKTKYISLFIAVLSFFFASCSEMFTPSKGSISVCIKNMPGAARSVESATEPVGEKTDQNLVEAKLIISGDENRTVTASIEENTSTVLSVDEIKTGSKVNIRVEISDTAASILLYDGEVSNYIVESGDNSVTVKLVSRTGGTEIITGEAIPDFNLKQADSDQDLLELWVEAAKEGAEFLPETTYIWKVNDEVREETSNFIDIYLFETMNLVAGENAVNTVTCEAVYGDYHKSSVFQFSFFVSGEDDEGKEVITLKKIESNKQ